MHEGACLALAAGRFNPRPAVRPGDAVPAALLDESREEFQSAPGREAGRCKIGNTSSARFAAFQSAPGREAGRCTERLGNPPLDEMFQSAPGREAGRCE